MRRADRLFQIVQLLRRGRLWTARRLAEELEVSPRTIYRDVRDLIASGVPIEGEAGVGYRLRGYEMPPLMFNREEVEALVLGARIVETWTDPELARWARSVLEKVETVLPAGLENLVNETRLFAPEAGPRPAVRIDFSALRTAVRERLKVRFAYRDAAGNETGRTVRPLALAFFGPVWTLISWCELRRDFRSFRPDRMSDLVLLEGPFEEEAGRTFRDFLAQVDCGA